MRCDESYKQFHCKVWLNVLIKGNNYKECSCVCECQALTLGSTLCPMWLTKRKEAFSTKTLVAALCVLALLRTRAIHLALIHICFPKQKALKKEKNGELNVEKYFSVFK